MSRQFPLDHWERLERCVSLVERGDRWGLEMLWLGLGEEARRDLFALHGAALGMVMSEYTYGVSLAEFGVGGLARECWVLTGGWSQVSEAEFFAALDRLAHPLAANEVTELAGYRYSIILAVMLVISGERTLLWESAREALVLQYPGQG